MRIAKQAFLEQQKESSRLKQKKPAKDPEVEAEESTFHF
jgi:hypothetical protein